ncbi:hypothetical protein [Vibrio phage PJN101]|nr:hypothetical protein [Vibrio phage PJN101]
MNLLAFYIYLIDVLSDHPFGGLAALSLVLSVIIAFGTFMFADFHADNIEEAKAIRKSGFKWVKGAIASFFIFGTLSWLIPQKDTMYMMGAAVGAGALADWASESETMQAIGGDMGRVYGKSLTALEGYLDTLAPEEEEVVEETK